MAKKSKTILSRLAKGVKIILSRPDKKKVNITLPRPDKKKVNITLPRPDKKKVNITLPRPDKKKVNITLPRPDKKKVVAKKAAKSVSQVRGSRILVPKNHVSASKEISTEKNTLFGNSSRISKVVKRFNPKIKTNNKSCTLRISGCSGPAKGFGPAGCSKPVKGFGPSGYSEPTKGFGPSGYSEPTKGFGPSGFKAKKKRSKKQ